MNDQDLDRLLGSYGAEAPAGLEERVLARVRRDRWLRRWPVWAVAAAAALALVFAPQPTVPERAPAVVPPPVATASIPPAPLMKPVAPARKPRPSVARRQTLTSEERQLRALVQNHPALAQEVLIEGPKRHEVIDLKPIVIEALSTGEQPQ